MSLFGRKALGLNDLETMKEAFGTPASTGKLRDHVFAVVLKHPYGVVNVVKSQAIEQRKFFVRALKEMTSTTPGSSYETCILAEANKVCNEISEGIKQNQTSFSLVQSLHTASCQTIWNSTAGKTLSKEGPSMYSIFLEVGKCTALAAQLGLIVIPILKFATYLVPSYRNLARTSEIFFERVKSYFEIANNKKSSEENNVFTAYQRKVEDCEDPKSSFYGEVGLMNSYTSVMALLIGSTDTTSTILNWIIFYLTSHSDVQQKLQSEIDEVIGKDSPSFAHKQK